MGTFLFPIMDFVSFRTYCQQVYFISTRLLKDNTNRVLVPQFQLAYIGDTTHPSNKTLVKLCCGVHYMRWGNQDLELQEWED